MSREISDVKDNISYECKRIIQLIEESIISTENIIKMHDIEKRIIPDYLTSCEDGRLMPRYPDKQLKRFIKLKELFHSIDSSIHLTDVDIAELNITLDALRKITRI